MSRSLVIGGKIGNEHVLAKANGEYVWIPEDTIGTFGDNISKIYKEGTHHIDGNTNSIVPEPLTTLNGPKRVKNIGLSDLRIVDDVIGLPPPNRRVESDSDSDSSMDWNQLFGSTGSSTIGGNLPSDAPPTGTTADAFAPAGNGRKRRRRKRKRSTSKQRIKVKRSTSRRRTKGKRRRSSSPKSKSPSYKKRRSNSKRK